MCSTPIYCLKESRVGLEEPGGIVPSRNIEKRLRILSMATVNSPGLPGTCVLAPALTPSSGPKGGRDLR